MLVLSTLSGCDFGRGDTDDEQALDGGSCVETVTVLDSVVTQSDVGFAAEDVLAVAVGSHSSSMTWAGGLDEGPALVQFGPESGAGKLTVDVKYAGGQVRFIESKPAESGQLSGYYNCDSRLEVDVEVELASEGGAWAETFTAPLRATSRGIGRIVHDIEVDAFAGSFAVTKLEPAEAELGPVSFTIGISESGLFGNATTIVELSDGDVASAGFVDVASWPGGGSKCELEEAPVGLADKVAGFSADDALALIASVEAMSLTWQGGEATGLTLAITPGSVACANDVGDSRGTLRIPSELKIQTADGRWDGSFAVDVTAVPTSDGALAGASVEIRAAFAATVAADDFAAKFGLAGIDLSGFDEGGMTLRADFAPGDAGGTMTGAVTVLGVKKAMCSDEPGAPCAGNDYVELDMAALASE